MDPNDYNEAEPVVSFFEDGYEEDDEDDDDDDDDEDEVKITDTIDHHHPDDKPENLPGSPGPASL